MRNGKKWVNPMAMNNEDSDDESGPLSAPGEFAPPAVKAPKCIIMNPMVAQQMSGAMQDMDQVLMPEFVAPSSADGEHTMSGTALMFFPPSSRFRIRCFRLIHSTPMDHFILVCILTNAAVLMIQTPGAGHTPGFNAACDWVNLAFTILYTIEALTRIVALGFAGGKDSYLRNSWNQLDFLLLVLNYAAIAVSGTIGMEALKPTVFRCLRAIRPVKRMRFFVGMRAIVSFMPYILNVGSFMVFFMTIYAVLGIQLFGGMLTRSCPEEWPAPMLGGVATDLGGLNWTVAWPESHARTPVRLLGSEISSLPEFFPTDGPEQWTVCPPLLNCKAPQCLIRLAVYVGPDADGDNYPDNCGGYYCYRSNEVGYFGYDHAMVGFLTEFVVSSQDEWPSFAHSYSDSLPSDDWSIAWFFFATMAVILGVITPNLFISIICYAFANAEFETSNADAGSNVRKLRALFDRIDEDGSGEIEAGEVNDLASNLGVSLTAVELRTAVEEMDADGGGQVDFDEFCEWWRSSSPIADKLKRAMAAETAMVLGVFQKVDDDGSGYLDTDEVRDLATKLGFTLRDDEFNAMCSELFYAGAIEIEFDDFMSWWLSGSAISQKVRDAGLGEKHKVQEIFNYADRGREGSIDVEEMAEIGLLFGLRKLPGPQVSAIWTEIHAHSHTSGSRVEFGEFYSWWKSEECSIAAKLRVAAAEEEARCRAIFDRVDDDGSGLIDRDEIAEMGVNLGMNLAEEDVDTIMSELAAEEVDFAEFYRWMHAGSRFARKMKEKVPALMLKEAAPEFPNIPILSPLCKAIVTHKKFDPLMMLFVFLNTVVMSMEHYDPRYHGMSDGWNSFLMVAEIVTAVVYFFECAGKVVGVGAKPYFAQNINRLDFVVALSAIFGMFMPEYKAITALRIVRVIVKLLRVMRMVRALAKYDAVVLLLRTVIVSAQLLGVLSAFIISVLMMMSVVATHILGVCHVPPELGLPPTPEAALSNATAAAAETLSLPRYAFGSPTFPRRHFYNLGDAFLSNFMIMSGGGVADLMYTYMRCAGEWSCAYFIFVFVVMNFFLLNVFVAVVLENFSFSEEEQLIKQEKRYNDMLATQDIAMLDETGGLDWLKRKLDKVNQQSMQLGAGSGGKAVRQTIRSTGMSKMAQKAAEKASVAQSLTPEELGKDVSLFLFKPDSPVRVCCTRLAESSTLDKFVIGVIVAGSIGLAIEGPPNAAYLEGKDDIKLSLEVLSQTALGFMWCEAIAKIVAAGFWFTPTPYMADPWNKLDFFIVCASSLEFVFTGTPFFWEFEKNAASNDVGSSLIRVLRLMRVLRPLRLIRGHEGMRVVIDAILACFPTVSAVIALSALFYTTFGILGIMLFSGRFYKCFGASGPEESYKLDEVDCLEYGGSWDNPPWNFDNIFMALRQLFIVSTCGGWVDIMHSGMDVTEPGLAPIRDVAWWNCVFFIAFVIIGGFFINSILIGVLVNFFDESSGTSLLTSKQTRWVQIQMICLATTPRVPPLPTVLWRQAFYRIVTLPMFDQIMTGLVIFNALVMLTEHYPMDPAWLIVCESINYTLLLVFTFEMMARVIGLGPAEFIRDGWSKFDLFIIVTSWASLGLEDYGGAWQSARSLRVLRITLVVKKAKTLRTLFNTLALSVPPTLNLTALLLLIMFVYAVVGMELYGGMPHYVFINKNDNFDNIFNAMKLLFQVATGQGLTYIMHEVEQGEGRHFVFGYFASFYVCAVWVYFNLFIAVILGNFQLNFLPDEMSISEDTLDHAKQVWVGLCDAEDGPEFDTMPVVRMKSFVPALLAPLGEMPTADPLWYNRLLFELAVEPGSDKEARVSYHEVLLALSLVHETYDGLPYSQLQARNKVIQESKEQVAAKLIVAGARRWMMIHHPPQVDPVNGSSIESIAEFRKFKAAVNTVYIMYVDSVIRTRKFIKARKRH